MANQSDIVIFGTGAFASRIVFDLAIVAPRPVSVLLVGRDAARLAWMKTAALARASMFGRPLSVAVERREAFTTPVVTEILDAARPKVVVNTASMQGARKSPPRADGWSRLIAAAGLGVSTLLQTRISMDVARAMGAAPGAHFINCCYPDVVNPILAAAGLPITSGFGNVAILEHAFAGALGPGHEELRLLAQHAALSAFRREPAQRVGAAPLRVWLGAREIDDVYDRFAGVKLTEEPAIDVSGASGIPFLLALTFGAAWRGHLPGPNGLPGGYPVRLADGRLDLDLPEGLSAQEAVSWNRAFEEGNGVRVGPDGHVRYAGKVREAISAVSPELAEGFALSSFDDAFEAMSALRRRLSEQK
ncbi:MAG: hypothetical protein EA385_07530 [Salinarimonadaceae bacterium]|nr:MAG: hypothetical protein EA385_07530 [Salinarimonadaceae bacterium]